MKITNAMYMISSSKLRRAKKALANTEPYFYTLQSTMSRILRHLPEMHSEYFRDPNAVVDENTIRRAYVVVTADKGMAGAYNHNILKLAEEHIQNDKNAKLYVIGEIGRHYFQQKKIPIAHQFHYTIQNPTLSRARNISETLIDAYRTKKVDEIYLIYTSMKNAMTEEAQFMRLLPLERPGFHDQRYPRRSSDGTHRHETVTGSRHGTDRTGLYRRLYLQCPCRSLCQRAECPSDGYAGCR